jgi:hypothetical protein
MSAMSRSCPDTNSVAQAVTGTWGRRKKVAAIHCLNQVNPSPEKQEQAGIGGWLERYLPERKQASPISNRAERNEVTPGNRYDRYRFPG